MTALLIGIGIILLSIYAVLPGISWGPQWGCYVIDVLKGGLPIIAFLIGLLVLFIGIADVKEKAESRREEEQSQANNNGNNEVE